MKTVCDFKLTNHDAMFLNAVYRGNYPQPLVQFTFFECELLSGHGGILSNL